MKIGVLRISDEILCGEAKDKTAEMITAGFFKQNIDISSLITAKAADFKQNLQFLITNSDAAVVVCDVPDFEKIKKQVCEITNDSLKLNEFAKTGVLAYFKKLSLPFRESSSKNFVLPSSARCILNTVSENVGFIFKIGEKSVFVIPSEAEEAKNMFFGSVLPLISNMFNKNYYSVVIKTFAISENDINELISSISSNSKINVSVFTKGLVCEILIRYRSTTDNLIINEIVSSIYEKIGKYIFTDENKDLADIVCDILKVQNKSLTIFEDATFGSLTKEIVKAKSFEEIMLQKSEIIATSAAKNDLCEENLDEENFLKTILQNNVVQNSVCVANLKCADEKNSYLIGICIDEDVEVYKIKLTGEDDDISLKLNQTALFYLIKKLKQKHF